jgi:hypothetical protein
VSRCGYIIPPNLYPKTHVLKKKKIDTPTKNNQVQHCCKSDGGKKGKVTFFPRVRSIAQGGAIIRTRA